MIAVVVRMVVCQWPRACERVLYGHHKRYGCHPRATRGPWKFGMDS